MPSSKERNVFDVIFEKMERLEGELSSKKQNEVEMGKRLKAAEASFMKKKEKFRKLKEERGRLYVQM